jgi:hypothetical protein
MEFQQSVEGLSAKMKKPFYDLMQIRLYYESIWLEIGTAWHLVAASLIQFQLNL